MGLFSFLEPVEHAASNVGHAAGNVGHAAGNTFRFIKGAPKFGEEVVKGTFNWLGAGVRATYDIGRGAAASGDIPFTDRNEVALANAQKAKAKDTPEFLAPIARPIAQAAETVLHPFSAHTVTPKTKTDRQIFGDEPIQNIKAGYDTNLA